MALPFSFELQQRYERSPPSLFLLKFSPNMTIKGLKGKSRVSGVKNLSTLKRIVEMR